MWQELFKFLDKWLPSFISGFLLGSKLEEIKNKKTAKDLIEAQYERDKLKNEIEVEKDNSNKSDSDILHDAIKKQGRGDLQ